MQSTDSPVDKGHCAACLKMRLLKVARYCVSALMRRYIFIFSQRTKKVESALVSRKRKIFPLEES